MKSQQTLQNKPPCSDGHIQVFVVDTIRKSHFAQANRFKSSGICRCFLRKGRLEITRGDTVDTRESTDRMVQPSARCSGPIDNRSRIYRRLRSSEGLELGSTVPEGTGYRELYTNLDDRQRRSISSLENKQIPLPQQAYRTSVPLYPTTSATGGLDNQNHSREEQSGQSPHETCPYEFDTNMEGNLDGHEGDGWSISPRTSMPEGSPVPLETDWLFGDLLSPILEGPYWWD